jgi:hypothetical protein
MAFIIAFSMLRDNFRELFLQPIQIAGSIYLMHHLRLIFWLSHWKPFIFVLKLCKVSLFVSNLILHCFSCGRRVFFSVLNKNVSLLCFGLHLLRLLKWSLALICHFRGLVTAIGSLIDNIGVTLLSNLLKGLLRPSNKNMIF